MYARLIRQIALNSIGQTNTKVHSLNEQMALGLTLESGVSFPISVIWDIETSDVYH